MTIEQQKERALKEYEAIKKQAYKNHQVTTEQAYNEYLAKREKIDEQEEYEAKCGVILGQFNASSKEQEDIKIINGKRYKLIN